MRRVVVSRVIAIAVGMFSLWMCYVFILRPAESQVSPGEWYFAWAMAALVIVLPLSVIAWGIAHGRPAGWRKLSDKDDA